MLLKEHCLKLNFFSLASKTKVLSHSPPLSPLLHLDFSNKAFLILLTGFTLISQPYSNRILLCSSGKQSTLAIRTEGMLLTNGFSQLRFNEAEH